MYNGSKGVHLNGSRDRVCVPESRGELSARLSQAGIRLQSWQSGDFETLWEEVKMRQATLVLRYDSILVRRVQDVRALVQFECLSAESDNEWSMYTLMENARTPLGAVRHSVSRTTYPYSLGVHLYPEEHDEPVQVLLQRLLQKTLGIRGIPRTVGLLKTGIDAGALLPGLVSEIVFHLYRVELDGNQFVPEGYVDAGAAARRHFVWQCSRTRRKNKRANARRSIHVRPRPERSRPRLA